MTAPIVIENHKHTQTTSPGLRAYAIKHLFSVVSLLQVCPHSPEKIVFHTRNDLSCDVLVHCGNFSTTGSVERTREFVEWFAGHPHRRKVLVAGNHDTSLDADFYDAHWRRLHPTRRDDAALREALRSDGRFAYLEHASATVLGYEVFGSPFTSDAYGNWAFHYDRGPEAAKLWAAIPPSTDVLVTHAPPLG